MAYTDESVRAKLSALNETQESIVTVAQWIMFHRRHADTSASVWLQKVRDSGVSKRLNLIYLANEVVQQSKARKKDDFLIAFSPIIAEATATAYRGATNEVQAKLRRVVEVWKQRQIFDKSIQEAVEARIGEIDKSRSSGKKPLLGGLGPFGTAEAAMAPELQPLAPLQTALNKAILAASSSASNSLNVEFDKLLAPNATTPAPPVYAARLSGLLKNLASASGAVSESIKARKILIREVENLLEKNQASLKSDEAQLEGIEAKKATAEVQKRKVEDEILKGLPGDTANVALEGQENGAVSRNAAEDDDRPQMEALTPPPVESFTPPDQSPGSQAVHNQADPEQQAHHPATNSVQESNFGGSNFKKRKLDADQSEMTAGDAWEGLDADVAELLRSEGGGS